MEAQLISLGVVSVSETILLIDGLTEDQIKYLHRVPLEQRAYVLSRFGLHYQELNEVLAGECEEHIQMLKLLK